MYFVNFVIFVIFVPPPSHLPQAMNRHAIATESR